MTLSLVRCILAAVLLCSTAAAAQPHKVAGPETGRSVIIQMEKGGTIKIALYEKDAPITTKNFISLVERKFYDGLTFHRVEPGLLIQGGDPKGDGTGGSDQTIKLEVSPKLKHDQPGIVAMARRPDPDSASCQFYITIVPIPQLDMGYAVFGRVTEGMDVVRKIQIGDVMKTVRMAPAEKPKTKAIPPKGATHKTDK